MTDVDKAPSLEEQYTNAAVELETLAKATFPDLHIDDREKFRKTTEVIASLLRKTAHEFGKYDQMIESQGKSHDKLLNRVHELSTVRSSQDWAELMGKFSKLVERDKEVGAESAPVMVAVLTEILKAQRHIIDQETQIEELQTKTKLVDKAAVDQEPVLKRVESFKRTLQKCYDDTMRHAAKNTTPSGVAKKRIETLLGEGCALVDELTNTIKTKQHMLIEAGENAVKEAELLSATQAECTELLKQKEELGFKVTALETELQETYNKFDAARGELDRQNEELDSLRVNYAECLGRLFKAKILSPNEIYKVGVKFLPQVTSTPEHDGFYLVNPEWHEKVVSALELNLEERHARRSYESVLLASVVALHNSNYPVKGDKEVSVIVAWDGFLSRSDLKSPTFSTGTVPLFRRPENNTNEWLDLVLSLGNKSGIEINDRDVGLDAVTEQVVSGTTVGRKQTGTEEEPKASASHGDPEPTIFAKAQPHMHLGAFTLSEEFIVWYNVNVGLVDNDMNELQARNDFRTYLGDKIAKFLTLEATPLVVIDWDAAAITGFINFLCPELSKVNRLIMNQIADGLPVMFQGAYL